MQYVKWLRRWCRHWSCLVDVVIQYNALQKKKISIYSIFLEFDPDGLGRALMKMKSLILFKSVFGASLDLQEPMTTSAAVISVSHEVIFRSETFESETKGCCREKDLESEAASGSGYEESR